VSAPKSFVQGQLPWDLFSERIAGLEWMMRNLRLNLYLDSRKDLSVINDEALTKVFSHEMLRISKANPEYLYDHFKHKHIVLIEVGLDSLMRNINKRRIEFPNTLASYQAWSDKRIAGYIHEIYHIYHEILNAVEGMPASVTYVSKEEFADLDYCCNLIAQKVNKAY
jgi:hypothetical protein